MTGRPSSPVFEILRRLEELKVELSVDEGRPPSLRFRPANAVPVDLLEHMRTHKADLIGALRRRVATERLITEQLAQLVPFQNSDGKRGWVHPAWRGELERWGS